MSSIPSSAMPHAIPKAPAEPGGQSAKTAALLKIVLAPPLVALGITAFAYSALKSLATEIGRKVEASAGSAKAADLPPKAFVEGEQEDMPV